MAYEPDPEYDTMAPIRETGAREGSRLGRTVLVGAGIAIAIGILAYAYMAGRPDMAEGEPPLVAAEEGPVKVPPAEPGGMEIPNQDKLILNQVAGQPAQEAEQLLPPPEQPIPPPAAAPAAAETPVPPPTIEAAPTPAAPPAEAAAAAPTPAPAAVPEPVQAAPQPAPAPASPAPAPAPTVAAVTPPPAAAPAVPPKTGGAASVQFAALKDRKSAEQAWARLTKLHGDLLSPLRSSIEPVSVNGATLYRLRATGLADQKSATSLCAKLKERKQDCTVVR